MPLAARTLVLALALMAATCGQKGPLTPPAQQGAAPAAAASETLPGPATGRVLGADIEAARSA